MSFLRLAFVGPAASRWRKVPLRSRRVPLGVSPQPQSRDAFFIFGYIEGDAATQNLFLPAYRPVLFVQPGEEAVGDDARVSCLPALDVHVCNRSCVFGLSFSDRELHM